MNYISTRNNVLCLAIIFLCVFHQIGDRSDSTVYIKSKVKAAEEVSKGALLLFIKSRYENNFSQEPYSS